MHGANRTKSKYLGCSLDDEDDWHQFKNAVRATIQEIQTSSVQETPTPSVSFRKGRSPSLSPRPPPQRSSTFSFTSTMPKKELDKRTVSPHQFPILRSGSMSRPTTLNKSRATIPNSGSARRRYPSEPRKSASMRLQTEKDMEQIPSKSKRVLKALFSRRKSKKDETLYTYLDEY